MIRLQRIHTIVLLGNNALAAFNFPKKVSKYHEEQKVFVKEGMNVVTTFHPSFLVRSGGKASPRYQEWKRFFEWVKEGLKSE